MLSLPLPPHDLAKVGAVSLFLLLVGGGALHGLDRLRAWRRRVHRQRVRLRAVVTLRRMRLAGWRADLRRRRRSV